MDFDQIIQTVTTIGIAFALKVAGACRAPTVIPITTSRFTLNTNFEHE